MIKLSPSSRAYNPPQRSEVIMDSIDISKYQKAEEPLKTVLRNELVRQALPLVHKIVGKLAKRSTRREDLEDQVQAGLIGITKALDKFDPARGISFSTYAAWWIKDEWQGAMHRSQVISTPRRNAGIPYETYKKMEAIEKNFGRAATAEDLGVSQEEFELWRQWPATVSINETVKTVKTMDESGVSEVFLHSNERVGRAQDQTPLADELYESRECESILDRALQALDPTSREVVEALFIRGEKYAQVSERLGMTIHKTREVAITSLAQLRAAVTG